MNTSFNRNDFYSEKELVAILKKFKLIQFISNHAKNPVVLDKFRVPYIIQYAKNKKFKFWSKKIINTILEKMVLKEKAEEEYDVVMDPEDNSLQIIHSKLENELNKTSKPLSDLSSTTSPFNKSSSDFISSQSSPILDALPADEKVNFNPSNFGTQSSTPSSAKSRTVIDLEPILEKQEKKLSFFEQFLKRNWKNERTLSLGQALGEMVVNLPDIKKFTEQTENKLFKDDIKVVYQKVDNNSSGQNIPRHMASGGQVDSHPGEPRGKDTIPAWLSPNEFVVNSDSAKSNKQLLEKINQANGPVYLASGGSPDSMGKRFTGSLKEGFDTAQLVGRAAAGDPTAIKKLIEKRINGILEAIEKAVDAPFDFLSGRNERAGDLLTSLGNTMPMISGVTKILGESLEALRKWNDQLLKSNLQFAEFSISMAEVSAKQELRDIQLSAMRGERRGRYAERHAESRFELEKRTAVIEDTASNIRSLYLSFFNDVSSKFIDALISSIGVVFPTWAKRAKDEIKDNEFGGLMGDTYYADMNKLLQENIITPGMRDTLDDLPKRWK